MANTTTNTFGYNSKSELIDAVMGLDDYGYNYDQIGNRITATSSVDSVTSEMDYLCNALNQYTNIVSVTTEQPTYDADGNMTNYNGMTYTWNGENRLVTVNPNNPSDGDKKVTFIYDYMGRRIRKVIARWYDYYFPMGSHGYDVWINQESYSFVYDGWNMIAEVDTIYSMGVPSSATNMYVWGLDLSGSLQGAGGIGGLLSVTENSNYTKDQCFPAFDANGNITEYTDTNGTVVAHYEYNPFGGTTLSSGTKAYKFKFRFSTKYLDTETDLYYYGYRYYSTELGRWISRDPIGRKGGDNLYAALLNNALLYFDPDGKQVTTPIGNGEDQTFDLCKCIKMKSEILYTGFLGKVSREDIFPPCSKPYKKSRWSRARSMFIKITPKYGFNRVYGANIALPGDEEENCSFKSSGGLRRFHPQVTFTQMDAAGLPRLTPGMYNYQLQELWDIAMELDSTYLRQISEFPIRCTDKAIMFKLMMIDDTANQSAGGNRNCSLITAGSTSATLTITH